MAKGFPKNHKLVFSCFFKLKKFTKLRNFAPKKILWNWDENFCKKFAQTEKNFAQKFREKVEKLRFLCVRPMLNLEKEFWNLDAHKISELGVAREM
jgi:hypothetical protein